MHIAHMSQHATQTHIVCIVHVYGDTHIQCICSCLVSHDHACTHAHAHLQQFCSVQCSCTSYSQILQCRAMANPLDQQGLIHLDQQGLSGFAMPDPYGLQDYCGSLLPDAPSTETIEALESWKFPQEAYPKIQKGSALCVLGMCSVEIPKSLRYI